MPLRPSRLARRNRLFVWLGVLGLGVVLTAGCYDRDALLMQARSAALSTRLTEVDLGRFKTTLPRDQRSNSFTELDLHVFGTVQRYRVAAVKRQIRAEEYRLRHDTLAALRAATSEELAEPSLAQLRARIERTVNGVLSDAPVKSVGFYTVSLRHH